MPSFVPIFQLCTFFSRCQPGTQKNNDSYSFIRHPEKALFTNACLKKISGILPLTAENKKLQKKKSKTKKCNGFDSQLHQPMKL